MWLSLTPLLLGFCIHGLLAHKEEDKCGYDAAPRPDFLQPRARILNAPVARTCEWPWMVAIRDISFPFLRLCAGVLIGRDKVITTASCLQSMNNVALPLRVILGEQDITVDNERLPGNASEIIVDVDKVTVHPQYQRNTYANDIAVIRLREMVSYNDCVLPACLPSDRRFNITNNQVIDRCAYAGWGMYSDRLLLRSARMRTAYGRYFDQVVCSLIYRYGRNNIIPVNSVCLEPSVIDRRPCRGDEGGMVVCAERGQWILESLINLPSCQDPFPSLGVDLRAPAIADFIRSN